MALGKPLPLSGPIPLQLRGILAWMEVGTIGPLLCLRNDIENLWVTLDDLKGNGFRGQRRLIVLEVQENFQHLPLKETR